MDLGLTKVPSSEQLTMSTATLGNLEKETTALNAIENEVIARAKRGATDQEIASDLGMTVSTLRVCWLRIRDKLGATNRTHAIVLASDGSAPVKPSDLRGRLVEALMRERVATWVFQPRSGKVLLDDVGARFFGLCPRAEGVTLAQLLTCIWAPDRGRFERFLRQGPNLRALTPIETRAGVPGEYRNLLRTANAVAGPMPESTLLLVTTTIHVFAD